MVRKKGSKNEGTFGQAVSQQSQTKSALLTALDNVDNFSEEQRQQLSSALGLQVESKPEVWELKSGAKATFTSVLLTRQQVEEETFVSFEVNGRDQELLTDESLKSLSSMVNQQFYPAIGRRRNGKIEFLDGSRRRAKFLKTPSIEFFKVLLTDDDVSVGDAKALAKDLQTAEAHNLYEIGQRCLILKDQDEKVTQKEMAEQLGISQSSISRAIKAANIDKELIMFFPNANILARKDYELLEKVTQQFAGKPSAMSDFIVDVTNEHNQSDVEFSVDEEHDELIKLITSKLADQKKAVKKDTGREVLPIAEFTESGVFARKVKKNRSFGYEFGRLPNHVQDKLDEAIQAIIGEYSNMDSETQD